MKVAKVVLRKKSWYQKPDCLFCGNPAILEAHGVGKKHPNYSATIRCCENPMCKKKAKNMAIDHIGRCNDLYGRKR